MIRVTFDCDNHNDVLLLSVLYEITNTNKYSKKEMEDLICSVVMDKYGFLLDTVLDFYGYIADNELGENLWENHIGERGKEAIKAYMEET